MCAEYGVPESKIDTDDAWVSLIFQRKIEQVAGEVRALQKFEGTMTRQELQNSLRLKSEENFRKRCLVPALDAGLVKMTIPDRPRSSKQKYRLTEKGQRVLDSLLRSRA